MSIQIPRGEGGRCSGQLHVTDALPAMKEPTVPLCIRISVGPRADLNVLENERFSSQMTEISLELFMKETSCVNKYKH